MSTLWEALAGLALGALLALLGRRTALVTLGGRLVLVSSIVAVWALGGWAWGVTLVLVALASGLSLNYRRTQKPAEASALEGHSMGARAILARVAWPAVLALLSYSSKVDYAAAFAGSLAAASADIWATEVGVFSSVPPRSPVSGRPLWRGAPGAVSALGTLAAAGAAGLTGFIMLASMSMRAIIEQGLVGEPMLWLPVAALCGGSMGTLTDSLLGATAQALYYCDSCQTYSEDSQHSCGAQASHIRGWSWMTNEAIDTMGSLVGAGVAAAVVALLGAL
jgi:uncharacterized membrane protein